MSRIHFLENRPELVRRRLAEIDAEERFRGRVFRRAIGLLLGAVLFGLAFMALGMMSTSPTWGPLLFWLGVLGADVGFGATFVWAYLRLEG